MRRALLLSVAVWLLAAAPASAETFRVTGPTDVTGTCAATQCASIRQALAAAGLSDGPDRIEIPPGDYLLTQGRLDVDSEVTLVGAGARSTTLRADPQTGDRVFYVNAVAVATISHLTMSGGAGADSSGGNLLNDGGTVTLDHVRVTAGRGIDGGGLANLSGVMTVSQSLIDGNSAYQGGGIANTAPSLLPGPRAASSQLTVTDTTIVGNETDYQGGGVASVGDPANTATLDRVTIVRNVAGDGEAGGLFVGDAGGTVRIHGSILSGNTAIGSEGNCGTTPPASDGGNVSATTDCGLIAPGDLPGTDPRLSTSPVTDGETDAYALAAGSPALDRFACTGADQRGLVRPQGSACDAGAYELDQAPDTVLGGDASGFTFSSPEPGVTFECALQGVTGFAACSSPYAPAGLAPGTYTLLVRALDASGQPDPSPAASVFTVAGPPPPTPTATPTPTPTPSPVRNRSLAADPEGTVLIKRNGRWRALAESVVPNGSELDTRKGAVEITTSTGETATFEDGIFKISQSKGVTTLTLTQRLTGCPKRSKARAAGAAKKPKTRRLWGSGKGKFRTKGQYSAATVRGTKWLVQDGCTTTLTRVRQGVVRVEDFVKHKKVLLKKGKRYVARAKR